VLTTRARCRAAHAGRHLTRRREQPRLRSIDLDLLAWVSEQYGAPATQLEELLGRGPRTVQRTIARLRHAGLAQSIRMLVAEPAWLVPTTAGIRAAGYSFPAWRPRVGMLAHVAAVNVVRLHVARQSPESEWVSERLLLLERKTGEHLPDGLVVTEGQHVAVEVELTVKSAKRTRAILDELAGRFDAIAYFCAPAAHRQLSVLASTGRWPALSVRELSRGPVNPLR
jgi:DNA-binding Lrp family transcriptional regulator